MQGSNMKYLVVVLSVFLLSSCSSSMDPREGGFIGGVAGIQSGSYERQLQNKERQVVGLNATSRTLKAESVRLNKQLKYYRQTESVEIKKINSLSKRVNALKNQVRYHSKYQRGNQNKINMSKRKLAAIKLEVNKLSARQRRSTLNNKSVNRDLTNKINKLKKELDLLSKSI